MLVGASTREVLEIRFAHLRADTRENEFEPQRSENSTKGDSSKTIHGVALIVTISGAGGEERFAMDVLALSTEVTQSGAPAKLEKGDSHD